MLVMVSLVSDILVLGVVERVNHFTLPRVLSVESELLNFTIVFVTVKKNAGGIDSMCVHHNLCRLCIAA